jgi:beta-glucosidase
MNVSDLTINECIDILSGSRGLHSSLPLLYRLADYPTRGVKRLNIPKLRFTDGPKGVNLGRSTCFPVPIARGASWDIRIEEQIGAAMAREASAQGANAIGSTCINLIRHPGWGRAQESFGADPVLLSEMGVALMKGIQSENVLAVIKHFACNSIENSRFRVNVRISERSLHEIYLPHFRACAEAGAAAFMSAYNKVNDLYCSENNTLLNCILREQWGFNGFVMSDFLLGTHSTAGALNSGLDMEMPQTFWFSRRRINREIRKRRVSENRVREAAGRVISQLERFGYLLMNPPAQERQVVGCSEHRLLSLESARRSIVLLKNHDDLLPFAGLRSIAVIGPFARKANLGSEGSASVRPPVTTNLLHGLRNVMPDTQIKYTSGKNLQKSAEIAGKCDAVIVTVGLRGCDEGEYFPFLGGGDRTYLELPQKHIRLIETVAKANPACLVILFGGSAIAINGWSEQVKAILMAWYTGMHGGQALAEIISGKVNPSGRLPLTFPKHTRDLPCFDTNTNDVTYDLYPDYRWFDRHNIQPAFAFGHGLSYTRFAYLSAVIELLCDDRVSPHVQVRVKIKNIGKSTGAEVIQLYLSRPISKDVEHPVRELKAFRRSELTSGETEDIFFDLGFRQLCWFNSERHGWEVQPGVYKIGIGPNVLVQPLKVEFEVRN